MTDQKLLPCPFCGSAETETVVDDGAHWDRCTRCGSTGPLGSRYSEDDDVSWNARAAPKVAVEGLPKYMDEDQFHTRLKDKAEAHNACLDECLPHIQSRDAQIAELVISGHQEYQRCEKMRLRLEELEAQLVKGKEGLPEPAAWVHPVYLQPGALGFDASVGRLADAQVPLYTGEAFQGLQAENERLRKDAKRYGWLCERGGITKLPCVVERILGGDVYVADGKQSIDATIDAALAKHGGQS